MRGLHLQSIVGALVLCTSQANNGNQDCACLGTGDESPVAKQRAAGGVKECNWQVRAWLNAEDQALDQDGDVTPMTCMLANIPAGGRNWHLYPQNYGSTCNGPHPEPGAPTCFSFEVIDDVDGDDVRVEWPIGTDRSTIIDEISVATSAGRRMKDYAQSLTGVLPDPHGVTLEELCGTGDTFQSNAGSEDLEGCDVARYNDGLSEDDKIASPWCGTSFCYVDPCGCTVGVTVSDYFPEDLHYSYDTCGAQDAYQEEAGREVAAADTTCGNDDASGAAEHTPIIFVAAVTTMAMLRMNI